jgi:two-component system phosphate regulon sensor histidine kinase PhoR
MQDISHEIKTPLMQISTTIELIQDNMPEYKSQFQLIQDKIQFISDLVRKILFIEKLDENLKSEKINLNQYLKNLIQEYKNLAKSKNITINLIENAQLTINAPKYYLDRLFGNLLSNAIKYNKQN